MGKKKKKDKSKNKINSKKILDRALPVSRLKVVIAFSIVVFILLVTRIGWIQFVQGSELKELASRQQTMNKIISPKRGNIYDTNGKVLAISAEVDTITINPEKFIIKDKNDSEEESKRKTEEYQEKVASGLTEIFSLDYNTVLSQVKSEKKIETIIKKVEKVLVDKLENWMEEEKIEERN